MDGIGKVDDGGPRRQIDHIAPGGEGKDFLRQQVALDVAEQVGGVGAGPLALQQLTHPGQPLIQPVAGPGGQPGLVLPVGCDAVLGLAVHVPGADLHLKGQCLVSDDGGCAGSGIRWGLGVRYNP